MVLLTFASFWGGSCVAVLRWFVVIFDVLFAISESSVLLCIDGVLELLIWGMVRMGW